MLDWFKNQQKVLHAECKISDNNELLKFENICIEELRVLCDDIIFDIENKKEERIENYKKMQMDYYAIEEALGNKNFKFQMAYIREKHEYIRRAIYTLGEACGL